MAAAILGIVICLHSGGWEDTGASARATVKEEAQRFEDWGYRSINSTYPPGRESVAYVLDLYDRVHENNPGVPIHAYGESAGGHLALMMAAKKNVKGVITVGAPTDLTDIGDSPGARFLRAYSEPAFGYGEDARPYSPALLATNANKVLLGREERDFVPKSQWDKYKDRHPDITRIWTIDKGNYPFVHRSVDKDSLKAFRRKQKEVLEAAIL